MSKRKFSSKRKDGEVKDESKGKDSSRKATGGSQLYMYVNSEQSLKDSASLAFSDVLGLEEDLQTLVTDQSTAFSYTVNTDEIEVLPGIIELDWVPSIGTTEKSPDTPINVAALNSYSYVRHANSGHANYDHSDFAMVIIAIAEFFAWLAGLMRLYGVISVFNQKNRYMARTLVNAMGFDYDDIVKHINDLRAFINHKISEASVLWIPNTMPFVARWFMMNSYVYQDAPTPKAQLYVFRMKGVHKFTNKTSTTGSMLTWQRTSRMTFDQLVTFTNDLISPLISDEDVGIMCGDILKAFGADKIYGLSQIPDEYINMPVYDEEVLMQIHNATIFPDYTIGLSDIKQDLTNDPGFIYQDYVIDDQGAASGGYGLRKYFDLKGLEQDPSIVMIASRLTGMAKVKKGTAATTIGLTPYLMGTEVIEGARIYPKPNGSQDHSIAFVTYMNANLSTLPKIVAALQKFDWSPMIYGVTASVANNALSLTVNQIYGEIENFTTIGEAELAKLHRTAVYTELGIPYI